METDLIRDVFDGNDEPFEEVSSQEMRYELVRILPELEDHEYMALSLYYEDEMTDWSEVGEIIGLEESEMIDIRSNAMLKLNNKLSLYANEIGDHI